MAVVRISPRVVGRVMAVVVVVLVAASSAGQFSTYYLGRDHLLGFVERFSLDAEANIPSWYSSVVLLFCAVLLGLIAVARRTARDTWWPHWAALSVIFVYVSLDEAGRLHELAIEPLREHLGASGLFYWAWVIPAMFVIPVLAVAYLRFLIALPRPTRRLFVLAATLFLTGALGLEMLGGPGVETHGLHSPVYVVFWTMEETLEMSAVAIFTYALLRYMETHAGAVQLVFGASRDKAADVFEDRLSRSA